METVDDVLEHFGVKGMKWGVRRKSSLPAADGFVPHKGVSATAAAQAKGMLNANKISDKADVDDHGFGNYSRHTGSSRTNHRLELGWKSDLYNAYENEKYFHRPKKEEKSRRTRTHIVDAAQAIETTTSFFLRQEDSMDDILEHFGVKGMKWGVRRKSSGGSATPKVVSDDVKKALTVAKVVKTHGTSAVSNDDLRSLLTRAELETKYVKLFPKKKSFLAKGGEAALEVLGSVAKQQATVVLNELAGSQRKKLLKTK